MKLYTHNFGGNLHQTAAAINQTWPDMVECVVAMDFTGGNYTVVVFRVSEERYLELTKDWNKVPDWEFGQDRTANPSK